MTPARKAELEARAAKLYRMICNNDLILSDLTEALEHVEREVFERAAKHFKELSDAEYNKTPDEKIADGSGTCFEMASDWCRTQAKETT